MSTPQPAAPDLSRVTINLADEGVPVRAIARATKTAATDVREILDKAVADGTIIQIPKDDWPSNTDRSDRPRMMDTFASLTDETLVLNLCRIYGLTNLQGSMFASLVKRKESTREHLFSVVNACRGYRAGDEERDPKIVDVVICHLRKRLKPHALNIETIWGTGYFIPPEHRVQIREAVVSYIETDGVSTVIQPEHLTETKQPAA